MRLSRVESSAIRCSIDIFLAPFPEACSFFDGIRRFTPLDDASGSLASLPGRSRQAFDMLSNGGYSSLVAIIILSVKDFKASNEPLYISYCAEYAVCGLAVSVIAGNNAAYEAGI